ncbi:hypothetical protein OKW30_005617 [Paraburkholderia sp. Clong3]
MSSMPEACCRFTSARLGKRSHPAPLDAGAAQKQEIPENSCCWPLHAPAAQTQPQTAPAAAGFKPAVLGALSCCTRTIVPFDRDGEAKHRTARLVRRLRRCARHDSRQWTCKWQGPCPCLPLSSYKTIQKGVPALRRTAPRRCLMLRAMVSGARGQRSRSPYRGVEPPLWRGDPEELLEQHSATAPQSPTRVAYAIVIEISEAEPIRPYVHATLSTVPVHPNVEAFLPSV